MRSLVSRIYVQAASATGAPSGYIVPPPHPSIPSSRLLAFPQVETPLPAPPEFDIVVAGGTLGIFVATAMQRRGFKVCVVERGPLKGRTQVHVLKPSSSPWSWSSPRRLCQCPNPQPSPNPNPNPSGVEYL